MKILEVSSYELPRSRHEEMGRFLLSEHTEAMQDAEPTLVWKEAMTTEFIESVLASAMTHQSTLVIQKSH